MNSHSIEQLLTFFTLLGFTSIAALHAAPAQKPNIIFILADDLGFAEVGANHSDRYQTPHIDSLAQVGRHPLGEVACVTILAKTGLLGAA